MSNKTKRQEWLDYLDALKEYEKKIRAYAKTIPADDDATASDSIENPTPPLPPSPPK